MRKLGYLALFAGLAAGCLSFRTGIDEGVKAPPTRGVDAGGKMLELESYRDKVVLLSFWHGA